MSYTIQTLHLENVINNHSQDMTGKVVAITGTTSGTGYFCAREMAKLGAEVLLLNRKSERSATSIARLQDEVVDGKFVAIECDLQDFEALKMPSTKLHRTIKFWTCSVIMQV